MANPGLHYGCFLARVSLADSSQPPVEVPVCSWHPHDHELQARREYPVELDLLLPCSFEACSLMLVFRLSTDAGPASHRVRLWRGGSASRVLPHRVSFPRVPLHGHQEVRKRPWPPLWGRGEMATLAPRRAQLVSGTSDVRCLSVPFV